MLELLSSSAYLVSVPYADDSNNDWYYSQQQPTAESGEPSKFNIIFTNWIEAVAEIFWS